MANHNLNVFKQGYYSWRRPFHNIRQFFRNIKYAWQRATKGYCKADVWDLSNYWQSLMIDSLKDFEVSTNGYPANMSDEQWHRILHLVLYNLQEGEFESHTNIYADVFAEMLDRRPRESVKNADGTVSVTYAPPTEEDKDLTEHYFAEEQRLRRVEDYHLQEGLRLLIDNWRDLWY